MCIYVCVCVCVFVSACGQHQPGIRNVSSWFKFVRPMRVVLCSLFPCDVSKQFDMLLLRILDPPATLSHNHCLLDTSKRRLLPVT